MIVTYDTLWVMVIYYAYQVMVTFDVQVKMIDVAQVKMTDMVIYGEEMVNYAEKENAIGAQLEKEIYRVK